MAVAVLNLPQKQGTAIPQLGRKMAKLVPRIHGCQRVHALWYLVACQHGQALWPG